MAHIIDESSCKMRCCNKCDMYRKELQHYKDLEEKGLLVELPCKFGDTVYDLQKMRNRIQPLVITSIQIEKNGIFYSWELVGVGMYHNVAGFEESQIGKTVFLTQSEAEKALADMEK